jgi:hypothetical protein
MDDDLDRSAERLARSEENRAIHHQHAGASFSAAHGAPAAAAAIGRQTTVLWRRPGEMGLGFAERRAHPFIAACVELVQAWDNPKFETRLPLTFDASCSGLQHLCAMTRDEEGGHYVNLIPSEETDEFNVAYQVADDFYRRIAYRVWEYGGPLERPFDRKPVKQASMSYFYGARAGGFQKDERGKWLHMA